MSEYRPTFKHTILRHIFKIFSMIHMPPNPIAGASCDTTLLLCKKLTFQIKIYTQTRVSCSILKFYLKFQFIIFDKERQPRTLQLNHNVTIQSVSNVKLLGVNIDVELNFNHHIALLCNKAGRQINALSRLSNVLNVDTKMLILQSFILSHFMYCCIIWHFCSISDTKKIEKMQLKALRHIYKDYTSSYEMLREKCNRPMLLIERQRAMLLEVYKCIHELGPQYRHGMFSQKSRAYDYRDPSILTLPKYNTITHGKKCFMYEGAKLWNSISNGIKTIENISEFKTLLKKWNGSPCICKNCIICTISYM